MDRFTFSVGGTYFFSCSKCPKNGLCNYTSDCRDVLLEKLAEYEDEAELKEEGCFH